MRPLGAAFKSHGLDRLAVFTTLLAIARIDEVMVYFWPIVQSCGWLVILNCGLWLAVIWTRGALGWLLLAAVTHLTAMFLLAPEWRNHELWGAVLDAVVVVAILQARARAKGTERAWVLTTLTPAVASQLILLYLFAAFAKLNADFLNPAVSCASAFLKEAGDLYHFTPASWVTTAAVWLTLVLEWVLPVLLLVSRTRPYGIFLGVCTHIVWGMLPHPGILDFSLDAFAAYFLFLPAQIGHADLLKKLISRRLIATALAVVLIWGGIRSLGFSWVENADLLTQPSPYRHFLLLFQAWVFPLLAFFILWSIFQARGRLREPMGFSWQNPLLVIPLLFLSAMGLGPYLGYRTAPALTHFSNLRTDGRHWNHLLLPSKVKLFSYEEDAVELDSTNMPWVGYHMSGARPLLAPKGARMMPFAGMLSLAAKSDGEIHFTEGGRRRSLSNENGQLMIDKQPVSWGFLQRKFLSFRNISRAEVQGCLW